MSAFPAYRIFFNLHILIYKERRASYKARLPLPCYFFSKDYISWLVKEHDISQRVIQVSAHPPRQLLSSSSFSHDVKRDDPNTENAKNGNAPFAAFLKNSLRDWSFSFFLPFFITLEINAPLYSPIRAIKQLNLETKKDVGVNSSAPTPVFRPSHCPHIKDKQRKPAHVKLYYALGNYLFQNKLENKAYNNTPYANASLHYLCDMVSKLRSLKITDSNVQKTSFPFGQPHKWLRRPPDSIDVMTHLVHE